MNDILHRFSVLRSATFTPTIKAGDIGFLDIVALLALITPLYIFAMVLLGTPTKQFSDFLVSFLGVFFFIVSAVSVSIFYPRGVEGVTSRLFLLLLAMYIFAIIAFSLNLFIFPIENLSYVGKSIPSKCFVALLYTVPGAAYIGWNTLRLVDSRLDSMEVKAGNERRLARLRRLYLMQSAMVGLVSSLAVAYFVWQTVLYKDDSEVQSGSGQTLIKIVRSVAGSLGGAGEGASE